MTSLDPLDELRAMLKSVYTAPDFLALEEEHIFGAQWLSAGRADTLKGPGDDLAMEINGAPIIILRDRDGVLRGLSNACRHRMSALLEARGTLRLITCPDHACTYNLDGTLRGAPAMAAHEAFCKDQIALTPGYFWYLALTPDGTDHVNVLYGGGMSADWVADSAAADHLSGLKTLLDAVNDEDKLCTEKVFRGLVAGLSAPGPLSHLERPNFEFVPYLASKMPA